MLNKEASWLYAELESHISFLAKSRENFLMRIFLNEIFQKVSFKKVSLSFLKNGWIVLVNVRDMVQIIKHTHVC